MCMCQFSRKIAGHARVCKRGCAYIVHIYIYIYIYINKHVAICKDECALAAWVRRGGTRIQITGLFCLKETEFPSRVTKALSYGVTASWNDDVDNEVDHVLLCCSVLQCECLFQEATGKHDRHTHVGLFSYFWCGSWGRLFLVMLENSPMYICFFCLQIASLKRHPHCNTLCNTL